MSRLTELAEWKLLQQHYRSIADSSLQGFFDADNDRFNNWSQKVGGLFVDYSKNRLNNTTLDLLINLAQAQDLQQWREQMFVGKSINFTEERAVLHTALRNQSAREIKVNGIDVMPQIKSVLEKMANFSQQVRSGEWKGYSGKSITDIVNIGIGGSDLGPRMVVHALQPYVSKGLKLHFVANIDGSEIVETLAKLNPETTLFIIESKTFTTIETITNAQTVRKWFLQHAQNEQAIAKHFVAVSTNSEAVTRFGIDPENMFEFWDWVGGRYSLWSAIGLPIILAIGMDSFRELLAGAYLMDEHFRTAPLRHNIPVILGLIGIWYYNFFGCSTYAVLPYDYYLGLFPKYLQQADMESNGKNITRDNEAVDYSTAPVIWGDTGVNGQHAYFQMLHQGTQIVPADFIVPLESHHSVDAHHDILVSNCIAQTEALLCGKSENEVVAEMKQKGVADDVIALLARHRSFSGNRPSTTIMLDKVTPTNLGSLIALYEHKIFVQGIIWGINSFDQWGVELGKVLANRIFAEVRDGSRVSGHGQSTNGLINYYLREL